MFRVVLLIVALAAGGAAAWLAFAMQGGSTATTIVQPALQAPMQDVLVASAALGPGLVLTKDHLRWQSWPESAVNPAYIGRSTRPGALEALTGSIVRTRMVVGEPVQDEKLLPRNTGFLSAKLASGKRAVAVRISAENAAGGFILPNDRVDVLSTVANDGQGDGQKAHVSHTILTNVGVLAIDQNVDDKNKDEKNKDEKNKDTKNTEKLVVVGRTATLEVDSQQAEILAAAEATGMLSLALRSAADAGEMPTIEHRQSSQTVVLVRGGRSATAKTP
jgi:pilus assembly protein CpaB